jgi:hypothetical protein
VLAGCGRHHGNIANGPAIGRETVAVLSNSLKGNADAITLEPRIWRVVPAVLRLSIM